MHGALRRQSAAGSAPSVVSSGISRRCRIVGACLGSPIAARRSWDAAECVSKSKGGPGIAPQVGRGGNCTAAVPATLEERKLPARPRSPLFHLHHLSLPHQNTHKMVGAFCRALPVMSRLMTVAPQRAAAAARPAFALRQPAPAGQRIRGLTSTRVCAQAGLQKEVLKAGDGATFPQTGQKVGRGRRERERRGERRGEEMGACWPLWLRV